MGMLAGSVEVVQFDLWDTASPEMFRHDGRARLFDSTNIGDASKTNMADARMIPSGGEYRVLGYMIGGPIDVLKQCQDMVVDFNIAQRPYVSSPLWMPPDELLRASDLREKGVLYAEDETPLDWTFLKFMFRKTVNIGALQAFGVVLRGASPPRPIRCVILGDIAREIY